MSTRPKQLSRQFNRDENSWPSVERYPRQSVSPKIRSSHGDLLSRQRASFRQCLARIEQAIAHRDGYRCVCMDMRVSAVHVYTYPSTHPRRVRWKTRPRRGASAHWLLQVRSRFCRSPGSRAVRACVCVRARAAKQCAHATPESPTCVTHTHG